MGNIMNNDPAAIMNLDGVELIKLSKLLSIQIDNVTCVECCKCYLAPETAACGHTLCHNCWRGRKSCPVCKAAVERRTTKPNMPIQQLSEHIQSLNTSYEKLFNTKLGEFLLDSGEGESENDPGRNIMEWLTSSQNHFSAPAQSSEQSSQEILQNPNPIKVPPSNIQVHTPTKKTISPEKVVRVSIPQDGWDIIETMPDTEVVEKNKENIIGPMDLEPFYVDENEYTVRNPRRSSRKRDLKSNDANFNTNNNSLTEKENLKDSSGEIDKKSTNVKQNWNNVKKMKKEFSKLNKLNKSKLNVSIEMCKKTQSTAKAYNVFQSLNTPQVYDIDENTPKLTHDDLPDVKLTKTLAPDHKNNEQSTKAKINLQKSNLNSNHMPVDDETSNNLSQSLLDNDLHPSIINQVKETSGPVYENQVKLPFYKKSALCTTDSTKSEQVDENKPPKTTNHNIESNSDTHEDIEITIKVGNTITNIIIKKKNDVQLKVNTDREVQTSQCSLDEASESPQKMETRNVSINIDSNNEVNIEHRQISQENKPIKDGSSLKSASAKKNTASATTGTGQFEITESVEKELSHIMECAEMEDQQKTISAPIHISQKTKKPPPQSQSNPEKSQRVTTPVPQPEKILTKNTQKSVKSLVSQNMNTPDLLDQEVLEYLNEADIFESDTVKQSNVQLLNHARNTTPSEILISTAHNRNKTQKTEKRCRGDENDNLPISKKLKYNDNIIETTDISKNTQHNIEPDSEPMNYDSIMGQVFAKIDADMEKIKCQNIASQKISDKDNISHTYTENKVHGTQNIDSQKKNESEQYKMTSLDTNNKYPKDSENIFSVCVEKDTDTQASAPKNNQVPDFEPQANIEDFLTPVMSTNRRSASVAIVESQILEINNDDSESVVEDTPQKDTSFGKPKPKSITNQQSSQRINVCAPGNRDEKYTESANKVVNLADTTEIRNDVTVIDTARKTCNLETPLNITKFVNNIHHNSTPVLARKSLNFETDNMEDLDPESTLCPTSDVAKTTQEKEFMRNAFEKTPTTQVVKPLNKLARGKNYCLAGSCLSSTDSAKVRVLCAQYKWSYVERYTKDLTHLVVGVDEEKKSQRSVKYMCALAASKWIVTIEWVERCLQTKTIVGEEKYEALDSTGEPGPRRSRVAGGKLFKGITFYCMEPFNVLDVDSLKDMLESSGGRVVSDAKAVRVTDKSPGPAILLAEPENTQEDRFIYLAMELSIVPVNFEWVLNCLGSYSITSVQELLLCPSSLLPKATERWPLELIEREDD